MNADWKHITVVWLKRLPVYEYSFRGLVTPESSGIYVLHNNGQPVYAGSTRNLRRRLKYHNMPYDHFQFFQWAGSDRNEVEALVANLLRTPFNAPGLNSGNALDVLAILDYDKWLSVADIYRRVIQDVAVVTPGAIIGRLTGLRRDGLVEWERRGRHKFWKRAKQINAESK